jgi:TonB family protein
MKNLILLTLLTLGCVCVSAQSASSALQEAQKITAEAVKFFQQGKYDEAAPLAQKAIAIREKELGKDHLSVAQAWRNLAYIQLQRNNRKEAEKAFKTAYEIYEKNQPLAHADEKTFVELLEKVAAYDVSASDVVGAEKKLLRAVELSEKLNGKDSMETALSLFNLAQIYHLTDDYERAVPHLLRALDIKAGKDDKLDKQTDEIYMYTQCALSKTGREKELTALSERLDPKTKVAPENQERSINGGIVNGIAISLPKPPYPAEARGTGARGAVAVQVKINEAGKVIFACAINGAKPLHKAAEIAAYQSKFKPTTLNGKTLKVTGVITYNFTP